MAHSLPPPSHLGAANPLVRYAHQAASGTVHSDDGEVSMKAVKEQWIRNQLRERESEFCERNNITYVSHWHTFFSPRLTNKADKHPLQSTYMH